MQSNQRDSIGLNLSVLHVVSSSNFKFRILLHLFSIFCSMFIECYCSVNEIYATLSALIGCMEMVISRIMFPNSGKYGRWALSGQHLANPSTHPPDKSARKSKTAKLPICPPMGSDWDKMARRIEGRLIDNDQTWPFNVNLIVGNIKVLYLKRWHFDVFLSSPPLSHSKIRMQICRRWESLLAFIAPLLNASCTMWMYIYIIPSPPLLLW